MFRKRIPGTIRREDIIDDVIGLIESMDLHLSDAILMVVRIDEKLYGQHTTTDTLPLQHVDGEHAVYLNLKWTV